MEKESIKFGLNQHFPKQQWLNESEYLKIIVKDMEQNEELNAPILTTAFKNIIAYLKSVHIKDSGDCEEIYESILELDPMNINGLVGLYECTVSQTRKENCKKKIHDIMNSSDERKAMPKALLEIGLALCLLIPKYHSEDTLECQKNVIPELDNIEFETEKTPWDDDLLTNAYVAQKRRVFCAFRYFQEGLHRYSQLESVSDPIDKHVWNFFLAITCNRLDNWLSYTHGSYKLRKGFTLKALELFCDLVRTFEPMVEKKHFKMYFQRCLAYIGQILTARKHVVMQEEDDNFVPDCFQPSDGHFLRSLWDQPKECFSKALNYGKDAVVNTRYAKYLLCQKEYDSVIITVNEIAGVDQKSKWYAFSIRMMAYKLLYHKCFQDAQRSGDFSELDTVKHYLTEAEKDGKYCFDTIATQRDQSVYATILRWLGTFPDGKKVTDSKKIRRALHVLETIYKEQGCHTYYKIHKIRAECHADLQEIDQAIKYAKWSLNTFPGDQTGPSIAFSLLTMYLLIKLRDQTDMGKEILGQLKYYTELEIKRCHELIIKNKAKLTDKRIANVFKLLDGYKCDHKEVKNVVSAETFSDKQQKDIVLNICKKYDSIFSVISTWCRNYPDQIKSLLTMMLNFTQESSVKTIIRMCLMCLGKEHKEWTQNYNKDLLANKKCVSYLDLCSPNRDELLNKTAYDFLLIYAPEDKEWVFYTFLPEMEDRPRVFRGCIPDFKTGDSFEQNVKHCLSKTQKILMVITEKFIESVYKVLKKNKIMDMIEEMYKTKSLDVVTIFIQEYQLDETKHSDLMKFETLNASYPGFDWNNLRIILIRKMQYPNVDRSAVIWETSDVESHVKPPENQHNTELLEEKILPYGVPKAVYIIHREAFIIGYEGERRIPRWVAHKIESRDPRGAVSRKTHKKLKGYRDDDSIPEQARSSKKDYNVPEDIVRGHMTPLADHSSSFELARETNIMTNIFPEEKNNSLWKCLEEYCRDRLTKDYETIYVMSGTLFLPDDTTFPNKRFQEDFEGIESVENKSAHDSIDTQARTGSTEDRNERSVLARKEVRFEVIGRNEVAVPTHLFKVIIAKTADGREHVGAFKMPNKPLLDAELPDISVSISLLESKMGMDLFKNLSQEIKKSEEVTLTTPFFPKVYRITEMIRNIDTLDNLHNIWCELPDDLQGKLRQCYDEKKRHLQKKVKTTTTTKKK